MYHGAQNAGPRDLSFAAALTSARHADRSERTVIIEKLRVMGANTRL